MGPDDFADTLKDMLNEKLRVSKHHNKHKYDNISTLQVVQQKDQLLKRFREPIDELLNNKYLKEYDKHNTKQRTEIFQSEKV